MKQSLIFKLAILSLLSPSLLAEELMEHGSFELPPVTRRKARSEGADLSRFVGGWVKFQDKSDAAGGRLILGLTNEFARTGRQSLFVHFDKLTKPQVITELSSELIPILPKKPYHVGIWGRVDLKDPVALDQRIPYLKLRIDWFKKNTDPESSDAEAAEKPPAAPKLNIAPISSDADAEENDDSSLLVYEQVGDPIWRLQPLPGSKNRAPLFRADQWSEFFADVESPEGAEYIKVTWSWETPPSEGQTQGILYFDDASILGESGPKEDPLADILDEPPMKPEAKPTRPGSPLAVPLGGDEKEKSK